MEVDEPLIERIREFVDEEGKPVDINYVAKHFGIHWVTVYKAVADSVFADLRDNHRVVLYGMSVVPLKTTKSLVLIPKRIIPITQRPPEAPGPPHSAKPDQPRQAQRLEAHK